MATPLTLRQIPGPSLLEACALLGAAVALELAASWVFAGRLSRVSALWVTGSLRALESLVGLGYWRFRGWRLDDLGLLGPRARRGWRIGLITSAILGAAVLAIETVTRAAVGASFLHHVLGKAARGGELLAYVAVGGMIAPFFEEFLFRGVVYRGLRSRMGPMGSTAVVTGLFALAHSISAPVPWIQAVGGVLFCVTYEISRSLWAPVILHAAGNAALFLLPLLF